MCRRSAALHRGARVPPDDPIMTARPSALCVCQGLYASRRIAKACEEGSMSWPDARRFRDFRIISDVRKAHFPVLSRLFTPVLQLCRKGESLLVPRRANEPPELSFSSLAPPWNPLSFYFVYNQQHALPKQTAISAHRGTQTANISSFSSGSDYPGVRGCGLLCRGGIIRLGLWKSLASCLSIFGVQRKLKRVPTRVRGSDIRDYAHQRHSWREGYLGSEEVFKDGTYRNPSVDEDTVSSVE
jgi:hypothetical protein